MHIGSDIASARRARGMSQRDLAAAVDMTQGTAGRVERGEGSPRPDTLRRIADALDDRVVVAAGAPRLASQVTRSDDAAPDASSVTGRSRTVADAVDGIYLDLPEGTLGPPAHTGP